MFKEPIGSDFIDRNPVIVDFVSALLEAKGHVSPSALELRWMDLQPLEKPLIGLVNPLNDFLH